VRSLTFLFRASTPAIGLFWSQEKRMTDTITPLLAVYQRNIDGLPTYQKKRDMIDGLVRRWVLNEKRLADWAVDPDPKTPHPFNGEINAFDCSRVLNALYSHGAALSMANAIKKL
jgi:hypothetical protein